MAANATSAQPANGLAVTHGANSLRIIEANLPPVVAELRDALAEHIPHLQPADMVLVERAARQLVRLRLLDQYIDRLGGSMVDSRGRQRGSARLWLSMERSLRDTLAMLGVGPTARAAIAGPLAAVRHAVVAEQAEARLRAKYVREHQR